MFDPYRNQVGFLLGFDGPNCIDQAGHIVTRLGSGIVTRRDRYGPVARFPGLSSDSLRIAADPSLDLGPLDFALEAWIDVANVALARTIAAQWESNGNKAWMFVVKTDGRLQFTYTNNGLDTGAFDLVGASPLEIGGWHHVVVARAGSQLRLYLNGYSDATASLTGALSSCTHMRVGLNPDAGGNWPFAGYMHDLRMTVGTSRGYSGSIIPLPAEPFSLRGSHVAGTVSIGSPPMPAERKVMILVPSRGAVVGTATSDPSTGAYAVDCDADGGEQVYGIAYPDYGDPWRAGAAYALGARTWVTGVDHWYEVETAGTAGSSAPIWPTGGGTVADGSVVWRDKGALERPWAEGPYLAVAA